MLFIKNKQQFLLSLFLLVAPATQCMDTPITILTLTEERDELKKLLLNINVSWNKTPDHNPLGFTLIMCMYPKETYQFYEPLYNKPPLISPTSTITPFSSTVDQLKRMNLFKANLYGKYSAIGGTTMAEGVSLEENIEFIQRLLAAGFTIRPSDKNLAIVERWERCQPIMQKIYLLLSAKKHNLNYLLQIPLELINYIAQLMLESEKSLF